MAGNPTAGSSSSTAGPFGDRGDGSATGVAGPHRDEGQPGRRYHRPAPLVPLADSITPTTLDQNAAKPWSPL